MHEFSQSLLIGQKGERAFAEHVRSCGRQVSPATSDDQRKGIDCYVQSATGDWVTVEVKTDEAATRTGNVFVEIVSNATRGVLGWAYTSQAQWLAFVIGQTITVLSASAVRQRVGQWAVQYPLRSVQNREGHSVGVLVPRQNVERLGVSYDKA